MPPCLPGACIKMTINKETNKLTIVLFAFGLLFSILGWMAVDKLGTINDSLKEVRAELKEVRIENNRQDQRIQRIEDLLSKPFNFSQNEKSN